LCQDDFFASVGRPYPNCCDVCVCNNPDEAEDLLIKTSHGGSEAASLPLMHWQQLLRRVPRNNHAGRNEMAKNKNIRMVARQWDAFFKQMAPGSDALRRAVARCLNVHQDKLRKTGSYDIEFQSRIVARALHLRSSYKEFRVDCIYRTDAFPAFGYEYQRSYDDGIPLRALMYEIAIREKYPHLPENGGVQIVILYSGRSLSQMKAKKLHGKCVARFTSAIFVDLNQLAWPDEEGFDLFSQVLALAREDAGVDLFLSVISEINRQGRTDEIKDRFKKAVIAAAMDRQQILRELRTRTMNDAQIQENLNSLAGVAIAQTKKDAMLLLTVDPPAGFREMVDNWDLDDVDSLMRQVSEAVHDKNWSKLLPTRSLSGPG
jgi:hypothetical protein